ncbi:MAG: hypothetical protein BGO55_08275 [Sphingobacteriales bacterium 50-39]|mgnify:CR=1 FL=1|nr:hypothetical protein [Sphingobacteriales bacterium]OJW59258.1 MAG: hypothetical protein BGO55_08275 [Sphingobacteriales bacterium 50-39]
MRKRKYLHDIIELVLINARAPMTTSQIARVIENNDLWVRLVDGDSPPVQQISARVSNHPELFAMDGEFVLLNKERSIQSTLRFRCPSEKKLLLEEIGRRNGIKLMEESEEIDNIIWSISSHVDLSDLSNFVNELGVEGLSLTAFLAHQHVTQAAPERNSF